MLSILHRSRISSFIVEKNKNLLEVYYLRHAKLCHSYSFNILQDSKVVGIEKFKELEETNETLQKEIQKLERAQSDTERLVSKETISVCLQFCCGCCCKRVLS